MFKRRKLTVDEIVNALKGLSDEELEKVNAALDEKADEAEEVEEAEETEEVEEVKGTEETEDVEEAETDAETDESENGTDDDGGEEGGQLSKDELIDVIRAEVKRAITEALEGAKGRDLRKADLDEADKLNEAIRIYNT